MAEFDPKGVPGQFSKDEILRTLCLTDERGPQALCYDIDWPERYLEIYKVKKMCQSRSIIDLM